MSHHERCGDVGGGGLQPPGDLGVSPGHHPRLPLPLLLRPRVLLLRGRGLLPGLRPRQHPARPRPAADEAGPGRQQHQVHQHHVLLQVEREGLL